MRSVLKNKKAGFPGWGTILTIVIGVLVIIFIVLSVFRVPWGAIIKGVLPKFNTTENNGYDLINGTDEEVYSVQKIPKWESKGDFIPVSSGACPYSVYRYDSSNFYILNGSGANIGFFQKKSGSNDTWVLFDLNKFILFYKQGSLVDMNQINYLGEKSDGAVYSRFDGTSILCGSLTDIKDENIGDSSLAGAESDVEYYVSDNDCFGKTGIKEFCIIEKKNGVTRETVFYLTTNSFKVDTAYYLNVREGIGVFGLGDAKNVCKLRVGYDIGDCLSTFQGTHTDTINMKGRIFNADGQFVFQKILVESKVGDSPQNTGTVFLTQ